LQLDEIAGRIVRWEDGRAQALKEGLNKGLVHETRGVAVIHPPQYGVIGACRRILGCLHH
jgi:hypothetical protein